MSHNTKSHHTHTHTHTRAYRSLPKQTDATLDFIWFVWTRVYRWAVDFLHENHGYIWCGFKRWNASLIYIVRAQNPWAQSKSRICILAFCFYLHSFIRLHRPDYNLGRFKFVSISLSIFHIFIFCCCCHLSESFKYFSILSFNLYLFKLMFFQAIFVRIIFSVCIFVSPHFSKQQSTIITVHDKCFSTIVLLPKIICVFGSHYFMLIKN